MQIWYHAMLLFRFLLFFKIEYIELKVQSFFDLRRDPVIMGGKSTRKGRKNRKKGRESGLGYDDDD